MKRSGFIRQLFLGSMVFTILMFAPIGRNPKALEGTRGMLEGEPEKEIAGIDCGNE